MMFPCFTFKFNCQEKRFAPEHAVLISYTQQMSSTVRPTRSQKIELSRFENTLVALKFLSDYQKIIAEIASALGRSFHSPFRVSTVHTRVFHITIIPY